MSCNTRHAGLGIGVALALLAVLTGMAAGQGNESGSSVTPATRDYSKNYPPERLSYLTRASDLIDTPVWDLAGHKLGKIEDFVVDWNSGLVRCALVWPQNLYGASNYYVAVPAKCFVAANESEAVMNTNLTTLIGSPRFVHVGWEAAAVSNSMAAAFRRFDQPLYWDEKLGPGEVGRYGSLMGAEVNNQANVNIGNLSDLVFDLPTERIMFAVISFYGEDQNEHALPFSAVTVAANRRNLIVNVDDSKVGALVNADYFLNVEMTDPYWVAGAYWSYDQPPGFDRAAWAQLNTVESNAVAGVENSPLVADDPELASADAKLARAVMTAIIQADLANVPLAQNIKISAANGVVTLTGRVPGESQKSAFEKIAGSVAGAGNVKNELEVR